MAGLSLYIDGVREVEADEEEAYHAEATDIEAEIESVVAEALRDHPDIESGATVSADYNP